MSYCRFGDDSDVYVYSDACVGGWSTHIAARRRIRPLTEDCPSKEDFENEEVWKAAHRAWMERVFSDDNYEELQLPPEGDYYHTETVADTIDLLKRLQGLGYVVPVRAFDRLQWEALLERTTGIKIRHRGQPNRRFRKEYKMWRKSLENNDAIRL